MSPIVGSTGWSPEQEARREPRSKPARTELRTLNVTTGTTPEEANVLVTQRPLLLFPRSIASATAAFLELRYHPSPLPFDSSELARGLPAGSHGGCLLWTPGEWFVYALSDAATTCEVALYDATDPFYLTWLEFGAAVHAQRTEQRTVVAPIAPATSTGFTLQERLALGSRGLIGLDMESASAFRFAWGTGFANFQNAPPDAHLFFAAQFLPLQPITLQSNAGAGVNVRLTLYF